MARRGTAWWVALVTAAGALAAGPAPQAAAVEEVPPQVTSASVRLDRGRVAVRGLASVPVTLTVRITSDTPVDDLRADAVRVEGVTKGGPLGTPPGRPAEHWTILRRTAGSVTDGTWSGTWHVVSTFDGRWEVPRLHAWAEYGAHTEIDLRARGAAVPGLAVTGTHQPLLTMSLSPDPAGREPVVMSGRLVDVDTGAPFVGARIHVGDDNVCGGDAEGNVVVRTDRQGRYRYTHAFDGRPNVQLFCSYLHVMSGSGASPTGSYSTAATRLGSVGVRWVLTRVAPAATTVPVGRTVDVTGSLWPETHQGTDITLQRMVGRTWRTVGTARVRPSGRFTLVAQPPAAGANVYRVVKSCPCTGRVSTGTASRAFRITGT
jgi:hypothetical protein